jgi:DNA-binding CsgD family transcriptional regulator
MERPVSQTGAAVVYYPSRVGASVGARMITPARPEGTVASTQADAYDSERRQPVLDAVVELQGRRRAAVTALEAGRPVVGARVLASGGSLTTWMMRASRGWRHLLSTRPATTGGQLSESLPNNRARVAEGLQMVSVFDHNGTDAAAQALLEGESDGVYYLGYAPIQMRLVDRREVLVHGPQGDRGGSILSLSTPAALDAAWAYWHAVMDTAAPCVGSAPRLDVFTDRQHRVLELLSRDVSDERIAEALAVSVRTVRYEIAAVMDTLGVRSRFAAGFAYAEARRRSAEDG